MAYDNLRLEKGLYTTGKSFTKALEELDPSENYKGTELEGLDAFERQLKRFDIKITGPNSDTISKFYSTSTSAVLFPEYVSRVVKAGIDGNTKVEKIIATTTEIDAMDYRTLKYTDNMDFSLAPVTEGSAIPECQISVAGELTHLKKFGRILKATYEAIKFQRLDLFSLTLSKIGEAISNSQFESAVEMAFNDPANTIEMTGEHVTYSDLIELWLALQPYNMTTMIADKTTAAEILALPELRDANAGLDFHGTGKILTPFGAEIIVYDTGTDYGIFGLDRSCAIEKVQSGGVTTEFDKLIDCQFERAVISTIVGFSPIYPGAVGMLARE